MSTLMIFLLILTAVFSAGLAFVISKDYEGSTITFAVLLTCVVIFGWILAGLMYPQNTTYDIIPRNKVNVITNTDKVFVTDLRSNKTAIFEEARIYNSVSIRKDSVFCIMRQYNMYGFKISEFIIKYN